MKRQDLTIADPCHEDWTGMEDRGERRFCDSCVKEVHDLSWLTADEAKDLLSGDQGRVCVRYAVDTATDEILFRDETSPKWRMYRQQEGVKALMAAAMVAAPLLMAGCEPAPATDVETPTVVSPIEIGESALRLLPGAPRKPTFEAKPLPKPKPEIEPLMGEPPMIEEPIVHEKGDTVMVEKPKKPKVRVKKKKKAKTQTSAKPTMIRMGDVAVHPPEEKKEVSTKPKKKVEFEHVVGDWG